MQFDYDCSCGWRGTAADSSHQKLLFSQSSFNCGYFCLGRHLFLTGPFTCNRNSDWNLKYVWHHEWPWKWDSLHTRERGRKIWQNTTCSYNCFTVFLTGLPVVKALHSEKLVEKRYIQFRLVEIGTCTWHVSVEKPEELFHVIYLRGKESLWLRKF